MEIFQITNLTFQYPDEEGKALDHLSLNIRAGEFVVIGGPSGCGKTTFLRLLKHELAPHGKRSGDIFYAGKPIDAWDNRTLAGEIGYIFQDPDQQIVMDHVLQEMVFGLENLGYENLTMRKRVAELVHTFGYEQLLHKKPSELSGGQKQILNLLSILLLKPKVLLLDEPTSQLDPIIAKDLLTILERLNSELGITIVLVEHRLEELFAIADRVILMESGTIAYQGTSRAVIEQVFQAKDVFFKHYLPSVAHFYLEIEDAAEQDKIPLTVKECQTWLSEKGYGMELGGEDSSQNDCLEMTQDAYQKESNSNNHQQRSETCQSGAHQTWDESFARKLKGDLQQRNKTYRIKLEGENQYRKERYSNNQQHKNETYEMQAEDEQQQQQNESLEMQTNGERQQPKAHQTGKPLIELKNVYFQFAKDEPMILRGLSLQVAQGEFLGIVGGNGSGKTTLLKVCLGLLIPQRGKVTIFNQKYHKKSSSNIYEKVAYLPQDPLTYFIHDTIEKEMIEIAKKYHDNHQQVVAKQLHDFGIEHVRNRHPHDCSGGEIQKAALACMLLTRPQILFIDEPTKGLDPQVKNQFGTMLQKLKQDGLTIVMVTHDIEFAAKFTTKCAMMFAGNLTAIATPDQLFKDNYFYTTMINRATQNTSFPDVLTLEEAVTRWPSNIPTFS